MAASFFHYIVIIFFSYCDSVFGIFINFQQCQSCEIGNYSMGYYLPRHSWQYSLSSHSASPRDWKIYTTIHDSASNIPYCNFLLTGLTQYFDTKKGKTKCMQLSRFFLNDNEGSHKTTLISKWRPLIWLLLVYF